MKEKTDQRPLLTHGLLGVVGPHHYHMNAVGWYRLGDPCYREYLRRVREEHTEEPFDVSQHRCESGLILTTTYRSYGRSICTNPHLIPFNRFLHDRAHFRIFQEWAHKFVYLLRRRSSHAIQTPSLCLWFWGSVYGGFMPRSRYTDVLQNWIGEWDAREVVHASPNTVIVHGKERAGVAK